MCAHLTKVFLVLTAAFVKIAEGCRGVGDRGGCCPLAGLLLKHCVEVIVGAKGRLGNIDGASKYGISSDTGKLLVAVVRLEVDLQFGIFLVGCSLLAPFFAHRREVPCSLHGIVAQAGLILQHYGVLVIFGKVDAVLVLLERCLNWVWWCPGHGHPRLIKINLQVGYLPVGFEEAGDGVENGDTAVLEDGVLEVDDKASVDAGDELCPQGLGRLVTGA